MSSPEFGLKLEGKKGVLRMLDSKVVARAEKNAVNTTATGVGKVAGKSAAKIYNIKARRIKRSPGGKKLIRVKRARAGQSEASIFFGTESRGDRANLRNFTSNKAMVNRKGGFKYKIEKAEGLKVLPRGFFATVKNNNRIVVQRKEGTVTGKRGGTIQNRGFISRTGPSTKQMVENPVIFEIVKREARSQFDSNFNAKLRDQLAKQRRRGLK